MAVRHTVSLVTVGCGRNEVDSDELAARLTEAGWQLSEHGDVVVVNTCGFIESARNDSLAPCSPPPTAARRSSRWAAWRSGTARTSPTRSRRRPRSCPSTTTPTSPPASPTRWPGCDRRCTFCAIPSFRGAFVSRRPDEIVAEAEWLAGHGVREVLLVSENTTSYGKDLGDLRALEKLLPRLAAVVDRVRVSYLQPAELRPGLIETIAGTPGVAPYFDVSFQHPSGPVLRRMRRFGDRERFLDLFDAIRRQAPSAGIRSNFIVGFPGETEADLAKLHGNDQGGTRAHR